MKIASPETLQWQEKNKIFVINWKDGHESNFPFLYLRKNCPCALCRTKREEEQNNPLKLLKEESPNAFNVKSIEPVGNYAIKIFWADGHSSGIYTYEMLRESCPCPLCINHEKR